MRNIIQTACAAGLVFASLSSTAALSQTAPDQYPQRNVKFILPFGPGTATDVAARMIAERLAKKWGKGVIVENRAGGDGLIAIRAFIQAADDHTLLYASSANFIAHPYTLPTKVPYDLEKDLLPIARTTDTVVVVGVSAPTPVKTITELVALALANPGKLNAAGAAGLPDFAIQAFIKKNGLQVTRVPYRDVVQGGRDLGDDRIQMLHASFAVMRPHLEAGKVRLLMNAAERNDSMAPGLPTPSQAGFPELGIETTVGLYGPAGMGLALRQRISKDVLATLDDPQFIAKLTATGQVLNAQGPDELAAALRRQAAAAAEMAKILEIQPKQ